MMSHKRSSTPQNPVPRPSRFWSVLGGLDLLIGVLLGAMLLPLIIGPFVLVYQFIKAGAYAYAILIGGVFASCVALALRGVRRGEFGPGTFAAVLALLALMLLVAARLRG
jgi:hypothetical protein